MKTQNIGLMLKLELKEIHLMHLTQLKLNSLPENSNRLEIIDIPEKQIGIIAGIVIIIGHWIN